MDVYFQTVVVSRHPCNVVPERADSPLLVETLLQPEQRDFEGTAFGFVSESSLPVELSFAPRCVEVSLSDRIGCPLADCECISTPTSLVVAVYLCFEQATGVSRRPCIVPA